MERGPTVVRSRRWINCGRGGGEGGRDEGLEKGKGNSYGSVSNVQFIYNFTTVSFYVPALLLIYRPFTLSYKLNCFFELPGKI